MVQVRYSTQLRDVYIKSPISNLRDICERHTSKKKSRRDIEKDVYFAAVGWSVL